MKKIIFVLGLIFLLSTISIAAIPEQISIQGKLLDTSGKPLSSTQSVTFTLKKKDGTSVYSDTVSSLKLDKNGVFNVILGKDTKAFPTIVDFKNQYWLGIKVGSDPELTPLQPLTSSPYALTAKRVFGDFVWAHNKNGIALAASNDSGAFPVANFVSGHGPGVGIISSKVALTAVSSNETAGLFTTKSQHPALTAINLHSTGSGIDGTGALVGVKGKSVGTGVRAEGLLVGVHATGAVGVWTTSIAANTNPIYAFKVEWFDLTVKAGQTSISKNIGARVPISFKVLEMPGGTSGPWWVPVEVSSDMTSIYNHGYEINYKYYTVGSLKNMFIIYTMSSAADRLFRVMMVYQ
ncbi:MAG: hypothetical protein HQ564_00285 [Candidatus Saganbacteria bacterium]|nr:hypothetical protein [Candidatus Saganbacteria bacterium]